jgi:steroid 5-alpha reductase family enzyme
MPTGCVLWCLGFLTETAADFQKSAWRANPANKGRFIDTGLWSLARHPNYGGEIMVWWGMALLSLAGLAGSPASMAAAVCSPLFVTLLLTKVSGVPMLQRSAEKRWGKDKGFRAYVARTSGLRLLFPFPRL